MLRILLIALFAVGAVAGPAFAKPKVALTPIDGDKGDIGEAIVDALDGSDLDAVSPKAVSRAIDKLGYEGDLSIKQARKLGKELEVDAVVTATYSREGKRKVLRFKLVVGGKKVRGFKVTFNNPRSRNFKSQLRDKLVERIGDAAKDGGTKLKRSKDDDEDDEELVSKKKKKKKKKKLSRDDDDEEEDDDEGDEDDDEATDPDEDEEADIEAAVRRVSPHAANRVAVRLDLGGSFQNRSLVFTQRANFPEGPNAFRVAPVPGMRFEGELYPLAFANPKSIAAGFGVAAEFDQTLSLTLRTSTEASTPVKAKQLHWGVGLRYRIPFGGSPTSPTVTLGGGIARRRFTTDRAVLMDPASLDVPDTYYRMFDPGLSFRIPLAQVVALTFGGKALLIYDAGGIQRPTSYGKAKVFGGSAQAGIDIVLGNRFAIKLVGEFVQVGFAFTGSGALSNARDRDPDTKDVGGAADRSIGGAATLAVLY